MLQLLTVGVVGYVGYRVLKSIVDKAGETYNKVADSAAKAIVGKSPIKVNPDITYTLPNGSRISASRFVSLGGAYVRYVDGTRYRIVAADPPGSGNYKVSQA